MGLAKSFEQFLNYIINKTITLNKMFHIAGNLNLNILDHDNYKKLQNIPNLLYQNKAVRIMNKSTKVTRKI